ncbi:Potassium voltage-gated channel subfamily KQT; possible potassium channel, VIC family [Cronobacter condimenti 1330]|uniref:Potassium voltage-gated channel subfamily KQT possible potassium channel, VIC family n=1 Tax=Cronobacter condimenti 1330 TaxID=1073999 RepID=K8A0Z7_9ENTR|nr:ion transporter [Cronobacter condimenti]ALB64767.1 transporter [Cronobacter condimenti 1330]CCJ73001.1 Potassium voltage-gated channel subfamily KQT; possible potassium channel, VIC family [Cronobacter condimenti 1330]
MSGITEFRQRAYHFLFDQHQHSGRRFEAFCGLFALFSVVVVFIESGIGTQYHLTYDEWHIFVWLEMGITLIFTLEYLLRLAVWPNPARYVLSFWGLIDLATVLPLYVLWLWPELGMNYLFIWRTLRAVRVLRILKLLRMMGSARLLWQTIVNARHQLIVFYAFISIVMVIAGALMYGIEGASSGFNTLGTSVYWAVVTVTTVGYGDITPHTAGGRAVASLLILIGYSVIAIPTGIITAQMTSALTEKKAAQRCPSCGTTCQEQAHYCHACGTRIKEEKQ